MGTTVASGFQGAGWGGSEFTQRLSHVGRVGSATCLPCALPFAELCVLPCLDANYLTIVRLRGIRGIPMPLPSSPVSGAIGSVCPHTQKHDRVMRPRWDCRALTLLRPAQPVATRLQREHQWAGAPIPAQGRTSQGAARSSSMRLPIRSITGGGRVWAYDPHLRSIGSYSGTASNIPHSISEAHGAVLQI
jgi:hypothetical protein